MKKFIMISYGFVQPTPEVMEKWGAWFETIDPHTVEKGAPFVGGMTRNSSGEDTALNPQENDANGFRIVEAENLEAAMKLLDGCPIIDRMEVYEMMEM